MRKKWGIICAILVICGLILCSMWKKPKIVNCITTIDTTYITVLWRGSRFANKEMVVQEVIEMCKKNQFADIKLSNSSRQPFSGVYITIYKNKHQMREGMVWMRILYNYKENNMKIL